MKDNETSNGTYSGLVGAMSDGVGASSISERRCEREREKSFI